jgi:hypothetical protein
MNFGKTREDCSVLRESGHQILTFSHIPLIIHPQLLEVKIENYDKSKVKTLKNVDEVPTIDEATNPETVYSDLKLDRLCPLSELNIEKFITNLLAYRGYEYRTYPSSESSLKRLLKQSELKSYSKELLTSIGDGDIPALQHMLQNKKHILACNRFGESTLHIACRKSNIDVVQLIFDHEDCPVMIDDYGRSPLHDAMWAISPNFEVIDILLEYSVEMLYLTDNRGFSPLHYIRKEHILSLCLYFYSRRDRFWPICQYTFR